MDARGVLADSLPLQGVTSTKVVIRLPAQYGDANLETLIPRDEHPAVAEAAPANLLYSASAKQAEIFCHKLHPIGSRSTQDGGFM